MYFKLLQIKYFKLSLLMRVTIQHVTRTRYKPQALEFRSPLFPHLVPPTIMAWILVWKYIFETFIHL